MLSIFWKYNYICLPFKRDVAQPGSVLRSGRRGRWFESSHPDKAGSLGPAFSYKQRFK
jgi:hypothetical protein